MRRSTQWKDPDVARYLLANSDYEHWRIHNSGMVLWITSDGTEMFQMDDLDDRASAVARFVSSRGSVSRGELEREFKDNSDRIGEFKISSVLFAPFSLFSVKKILEDEFPLAKVSIYTSGYNGAKTIHVRGDDCDFEGYPESSDGAGTDSDYLFNGSIESTAAASVAKAKQLFSKLIDAGIDVQYEVYDPNGTTLFEQNPTRENKRMESNG